MKVDLDVCKTERGLGLQRADLGADGESDWAVCTLQEGEGKGTSFVGQACRLGSHISRDYILGVQLKIYPSARVHRFLVQKLHPAQLSISYRM
jgi:hypothetical protein